MTFALAPTLDTEAATPLRASLLQAISSGTSVTLDGSAVERAGTACLQVLVAAKAAAEAEGLSFRLLEPSATLLDAARMAALDALFDC